MAGRMLLVLAVVLGVGGSAAVAEEKVTVTGQAVHPHDPNEIVCKKAAPPAGSRIGRGTICHSAARWAQIHMNAQDDMEEMQNRDVWANFRHF